MAPITNIVRRDMSSGTTTALVAVFLGLLILSTLCVGALWFLRRVRHARKASGKILPTPDVEDGKLAAPKRGHRRSSSISIASTVSVEKKFAQTKFVDEEKQQFMANTSPPPSAGLPQIHVTFPEDTDEGTKRQSRVVVLHMDDKGGVGMAPVPETEKPQTSQHERFVSLDLDRIGGLKEKDRTQTKSVHAS